MIPRPLAYVTRDRSGRVFPGRPGLPIAEGVQGGHRPPRVWLGNARPIGTSVGNAHPTIAAHLTNSCDTCHFARSKGFPQHGLRVPLILPPLAPL
jgi:hypothetical protein